MAKPRKERLADTMSKACLEVDKAWALVDDLGLTNARVQVGCRTTTLDDLFAETERAVRALRIAVDEVV